MRKAAALRNARKLQDAAALAPHLTVVQRYTYKERFLADELREEAAGRRVRPSLAEAKLADRIDNWIRVNRWFRAVGRSLSLEGYFRPPRGVEMEYETGDPPPKPPEMTDIHDAWRIELAWRSLHRKARWMIKFSFHDKAVPAKACRLMKSHFNPPIFIHPSDWNKHRSSAIQDLRDALIRRQSVKETAETPVPADFFAWRARKQQLDLADSLADQVADY